MRAAPLVLLLALAASGCQMEPSGAPVEESPTARAPAPAVDLPTSDGPVALEGLQGGPVVIVFAPRGHAAWDALRDVVSDLEASGATVLAVEADGEGAAAAKAFGYRGQPVAVVVDGEGAMRGAAAPTSGDAVFALAAPVLAEADLAKTVSWESDGTLEGLVSAGGVVVHLGDAPDTRGLQIAPESLAPDVLPADLGTPLAFAGDGAEAAAQKAGSWGYAAVFVVDDATTIREVAPPLPAPRPTTRPGGVRG